MVISVGICTWNRADLLDATLARLARVHVPQGVDWEVLVVNNCCTDHTDQVLGAHATDLPLRRLYEPKPGLSNARNRALAAARGELVIWTDDDVLVDEDWLAEYYKAAVAFPQAVYFGGTVDPLFEVDPPSWVHRHPSLVEGPFALRQLGAAVRPFEASEYPFGANMAFRILRVAGGLTFDPNLGRVGESAISGEETQVLQALKQQEALGVWVGTARVRHFIPRERLQVKYVWRFWVGLGATQVRMHGVPPGKRLFGVPRWLIRRHVRHRAEMAWRSWWKDQRWERSFQEAARTWGMLREIGRQSAAARRIGAVCREDRAVA